MNGERFPLVLDPTPVQCSYHCYHFISLGLDIEQREFGVALARPHQLRELLLGEAIARRPSIYECRLEDKELKAL